MTEPQALGFSSRTEFESQLRECIACARVTLQLFDPDFAVFPLGESGMDALLRGFLAGGGTLQLAMHSTGHIERAYPRFLRLLRDYAHLVECRATDRALHQLTDSFCIADGIHIVRRYHSDHLRGEAVYNAPAATDVPRGRFAAIWAESRPALQATTTGL
jgi:uncharacterized protein YjiS (DUF1127 family)